MRNLRKAQMLYERKMRDRNLGKRIKENYGFDELEDEEDGRFYCSSYYGINYSGLEDDFQTNDYDEMETWVWDKIQHGGFVEVVDYETGERMRYNPDKVEWGDEAYGIEDYLDESKNKKINRNRRVKENYDYDDKNDDYWLINHKSVMDSDGFYTDYTWYKRASDGMNVFVFGDNDIYRPEDEDFDWETKSDEEAEEWFDSYNGFDELEEVTGVGSIANVAGKHIKFFDDEKETCKKRKIRN